MIPEVNSVIGMPEFKDYYEKLCIKIKKELKSRNLGYKCIADDLGLNEASLSKKLNGNYTTFNILHIKKLAGVLGMSVDELLKID